MLCFFTKHSEDCNVLTTIFWGWNPPVKRNLQELNMCTLTKHISPLNHFVINRQTILGELYALTQISDRENLYTNQSHP